MEIIVAKTAGFCFGVERAIGKANELTENEKIYTYGPMIHNPIEVKRLEERGAEVVEDTDAFKNLEKRKVLIRSHGVDEKTIEEIKANGYSLDIKNPNNGDPGHGDPEELLVKYQEILASITKTRNSLKQELSNALSGESV